VSGDEAVLFHAVNVESEYRSLNILSPREVATYDHADEEVAPTGESEHTFINYREAVGARLQALPAPGFERFCQRLLRECGCEEVTLTGRSGDGGIDGIGILQVNALVDANVDMTSRANVKDTSRFTVLETASRQAHPLAGRV
jgi:restriction system protein